MKFKLIDFIIDIIFLLVITGLVVFASYQHDQIKELNHKVTELSEAMTKLDRLLLGDDKHMGLIQ